MLKTLNTLTSLVANEGVTGAVTRSLQAMERSFEARITGVRNDFANRAFNATLNLSNVVAENDEKIRARVDRLVEAVHNLGARIEAK